MWPFASRSLSVLVVLLAFPLFATVFGSLRGVVHDPQHRPIAHAHALLISRASDYKVSLDTDAHGEFVFSSVPVGGYTVRVEAPGFAAQDQVIELTSGSAPVLHYQLAISAVSANVEVSATASEAEPARTTLISREQIARYAGVDDSNSFRIITDFVPGAYMVHDQLHVRGGHQVTYAIDGVPLPNTNIASNVGPQFNPKDVDYLEAQTGGYSADYGDRTYGVFNFAPRTGFERDRQGELVTSYGNYHSTDDQISFGSHTQKFAYYASLNGHRSDYGLEPPTALNLHNQVAGGSGFTSLIYNPSANDQLRFNGSFRADYYQVPNDRDLQDAGVRDREREQDSFATFTWVHNFSSIATLTISPFYHFNRAAYEGGQADIPSAIDNRRSNFEGGQTSLSIIKGRSNFRAGVYAFAQQDNTFFSVVANDGSGAAFRQRVRPGGNLESLFLEEQFKAATWLTLSGGMRFTHFGGLLNENAADPRIGAAVRLPRLNWVLRASYARFYQAPPLDTLSGPLLDFAASQGAEFLPLHGERDEQHEFGIAIPLRQWTADLAYFRTAARNFFDHDVIGNSNIFFPLTIASARIRGYEATLKSPLMLKRYHAHLAYSNQQAQGFGDVTGGLFSFAPPQVGGFYLDHDQRNTLSTGVDGSLPWHAFAAVNLNYGSGFLDGNGPQHLPGHTTIDLSLGKSFGENFTVRFSGANLANRRYQLDTSNTFGGSHFADPRMVSVQLRYQFHY